ncbi:MULTISPECIES: hypothetical protein [unclassified Mesorhizobium]|uniref:hypothetical protein n=1 Tax=unclassified Mesorhizobium TaxID=325217 RepID=UPI000F7623DC|nr:MULTISPECIES: hypothetical protein [unclassified Mesorhizobium]AZO06195.1 hypothetical protein EJ068_26315 [Mesorhizobium sp. M2A.F.Ca.ET.043.02.1.1]RUW33005.1 hypothetical protein EOA37_31300 [Mesorhizobium sp. M2A.F.Ca.ET.015.02.1.1]RUW67892.1 hypothetical protein EOA28_28200 [Mesorhizobium sp. M2A.F.Ca.ET.067.02.1.1]RVC95325.1 hypothetical protein EN739_13445 [Mesorhizobium sp. M2A.F.Ca.ET.017.03.2.1]RVC98746.1 hypothetical protein EN753_28320 [Mesorhizobium sp. M2A.F.Ca.ET.029.05.1.1]
MSQRAFITLLVLLAVLLALSATSFPGAMIGFLFGIAIALFVAGPAMLIGKVLENNGIPISGGRSCGCWPGFMRCLLSSRHSRPGAGFSVRRPARRDPRGCGWRCSSRFSRWHGFQ